MYTRKWPDTLNVAEKEGDEPRAFRINNDGSISLKTISNHFPGTIGLGYRDPRSFLHLSPASTRIDSISEKRGCLIP